MKQLEISHFFPLYLMVIIIIFCNMGGKLEYMSLSGNRQARNKQGLIKYG